MKRFVTTVLGLTTLVAGLPAPPLAAQAGPLTATIAWEGAYFGLDPTTEYSYETWELYTSLLLRTLVTYEHISGAEGTDLVADLAMEVPEPTDGGLTYRFHLKPGIVFGPPVNRPVTSADIEYAFVRMAHDSYGSYGSYYRGVIEGMTPDVVDDVSGIETPDDSTIVFHLKEPTGDFLHRLTLPATAPIPNEVAECFVPFESGRRRYGRRLIATGPYMLEGSEDMDISSGCDGMEPISGYQPGEENVFLVRNPNYLAATDGTQIREPVFDRFEFLNLSGLEAFTGIEDGTIDTAMFVPSRRRAKRYSKDDSDHPAVHSAPNDTVWYVTMNLTQKPFDDVHVRRAVNYMFMKAGVPPFWGEETWGRSATHILPPELTGGHPTAEEYDPYGTLDYYDPKSARREMRLSRYDEDGDGRCDAAACESVRLVNRNERPWTLVEQVVGEALLSLGITPDDMRADTGRAYDMILDISRNTPIAMNPGWRKDYSDAGTYFKPLFHSSSLKQCYSTNYSLVGATPKTEERCNADGNYRNVPSVDSDIEACTAVIAEAERQQCWIGLDRKLMEDIVPWVPMIWGNAVWVTGPGIGATQLDQFTGEVSLAHLAP